MNPNLRLPQPLSRIEFASALRKGLGRAYLHVLSYGLTDNEDILLEASLHNQVYDPQIESTRSDWLLAMFQDTPSFPSFRADILNAVKNTSEWRDLSQLAGFTADMAASGDSEALAALGEIVCWVAANPAYEMPIGVYDWLDLGGTEGMLSLARIYGKRLEENPEEFLWDNQLLDQDHLELRDILRQNALLDADIKRYADYLDQREILLNGIRSGDSDDKNPFTQNRIRARTSLADIMEAARKKRGSLPGHYLSFGKQASDEERIEIFHALIAEPDEAVCTRLLWVFQKAELPGLDERIFAWAQTGYSELRSAAIKALARIAHPRVHELAMQKITAGEVTGSNQNVLSLFSRNYYPEDAVLIGAHLENIQPFPEEAHSLGYDIRDLTNRFDDPELLSAVLWAYENTPCSFCRLHFVSWMNGHGLLPDKLRLECQYDSNEDIRKLFK